jgi:hypothetical protein
MNSRRFCIGSMPVDLQAELTFTTSGAAVAPVYVNAAGVCDGRNAGIKNFVQCGAAAAAGSGGEVYLVGLDDRYARHLDSTCTCFGQVPTADSFWVPSKGDGVSGGAAVIVTASAAQNDTVTIKIPGSAAIVLTARTSASTDSQWTVSTGDTTAVNLASIINTASGTGAGCCAALIALGNPILAVAVGHCVVLTTSLPGVLIQSSNATRLPVACPGALNTVAVYGEMTPAIPLVFTVAGVTPTVPASGQFVRLHIILENSTLAP